MIIVAVVVVVIIVSILLFKKKKDNTYPPEVHVYPLSGSTMTQSEKVQVNVYVEQKTAPVTMESRNVGFENQATPSRMGADVANEGVA